jgi:hypothetical protein
MTWVGLRVGVLEGTTALGLFAGGWLLCCVINQAIPLPASVATTARAEKVVATTLLDTDFCSSIIKTPIYQ